MNKILKKLCLNLIIYIKAFIGFKNNIKLSKNDLKYIKLVKWIIIFFIVKYYFFYIILRFTFI